MEETKEGAVVIKLSGRIDSGNAPAAEENIRRMLEGKGTCPVVLDAEELAYISSAGLRVLLGATQQMEGKGEMIVRNVTTAVREVFDLTGFNKVFKIE